MTLAEPSTDDILPPAGTITRRGLMLVISSPSGAGKSTLARALLDSEAGLEMSVSVTTRRPRPGEINGVHYHFVTEEDYHNMLTSNGFLEHARVFDNYYGTPRAPVENALAEGRDILFDVDWQGTQQLRESAENDLASVFILPPDLRELERRLTTRALDPADVVAKRMARAMDEISHYPEYDYIIVNDDLDRSIGDLRTILRAERLRRTRRTGLAGFVNRMRDPESDTDPESC